MTNAFIDIFYFLSLENPSNGNMLVEFVAFYKASQLFLLESFLDLAKRKFDRIVLWRVWYDPYPFDFKVFHQLNCFLSFMGSQIIHNDSDMFSIIDLMEFADEATEYFRVHGAVMKLEIFEATSFANCCNDCCVANIRPFDGYPDVFIALAPLLREICILCEHSLVKPNYFSLLLDCSSELLFHDVSEAIITILIDSLWHFSDINRLTLD